MTKSEQLEPVIEHHVVVGWYAYSWISPTKRVRVFIPRRDEDIENDRFGGL